MSPEAERLAIDEALHQIEQELQHHLDAMERIAVTRALEQLAGEVRHASREFQPW